ncbi:MAG: NAD(P)-dependent oxidoreductase, partial [Pseudomonadota bacterium]
RALLSEGHAVTALVRAHADQRRPELLPDVVQQPLNHLCAPAWARVLDECAPDALLLLAGAVRGRAYSDFAQVNVEPLRALLHALQGRQTPRLLLVSSLAASAPELSYYAASKRAGERVLEGAPAPVTVLRPPAVYGPGDRELLDLFALIRRGWVPRPGPPTQRLALLHVDDLARAIVAALAIPAHRCAGVYALDDGHFQGYSWREIAESVAPDVRTRIFPIPSVLLQALGTLNLWSATVFGYAPMLTPGKARELGYSRWLCDNRAFTAATGWQPTIDLATGMATLGD